MTIQYFIKLSSSLPVRVRPYRNKYALIVKIDNFYHRIDSGDYSYMRFTLLDLKQNCATRVPSWILDQGDLDRRFENFLEES